MTSFTVWVVLMVVALIAVFVISRRDRPQEDVAESIAADALPKIGEIAERQHTMRFGRPPTNTPGPPGESIWYPPKKTKRPKHA